MVGNRRDLEMNVDAIQEGAAQFGEIAIDLRCRAIAPLAGIIAVTTRTRVHGGDKLKACLIADMHLSARKRHRAGFNRLTQSIERLTREFRQFIQKKHAIMRQRNLARAGVAATANEGGHAGRMMRCAKRALVRQPHPTALGTKAFDQTDLKALLWG